MLVEQPSAFETQANGVEKGRRYTDPGGKRLILPWRRRMVLEIEVVGLAGFARRTAVRDRRGADAGQRLHPLERALPERLAIGLATVARSRERHGGSEDVARFHPDADATQTVEADENEQSGNEERRRQRELPGHQRAANAPRRGPSVVERVLARRRTIDSSPRTVERRNQSADENRKAARDTQDRQPPDDRQRQADFINAGNVGHAVLADEPDAHRPRRIPQRPWRRRSARHFRQSGSAAAGLAMRRARCESPARGRARARARSSRLMALAQAMNNTHADSGEHDEQRRADIADHAALSDRRDPTLPFRPGRTTSRSETGAGSSPATRRAQPAARRQERDVRWPS